MGLFEPFLTFGGCSAVFAVLRDGVLVWVKGCRVMGCVLEEMGMRRRRGRVAGGSSYLGW